VLPLSASKGDPAATPSRAAGRGTAAGACGSSGISLCCGATEASSELTTVNVSPVCSSAGTNAGSAVGSNDEGLDFVESSELGSKTARLGSGFDSGASGSGSIDAPVAWAGGSLVSA
jgi:hypothetical protein